MSDGRTAVGFDRLPWLADEPEPARRSAASRGLALLLGRGSRSCSSPVRPTGSASRLFASRSRKRRLVQSTTVALPAGRVRLSPR